MRVEKNLVQTLTCQSSHQPSFLFFQSFTRRLEYHQIHTGHLDTRPMKNPRCRRKILVILNLIRTDSKAEMQRMIAPIRNYKGKIQIMLYQPMREESRTKTSKWEETYQATRSWIKPNAKLTIIPRLPKVNKNLNWPKVAHVNTPFRKVVTLAIEPCFRVS